MNQMNKHLGRVAELSDGIRSSGEIAGVVGLSPRYVRRLQERHGLPRLKDGGRSGAQNHEYVSGRRVDPDGYVLVTAPQNHPYARKRTQRDTKLIFEHRLVLEQTLGRYLLPTEIVDHRDGLTLHNAPDNLRLFDRNAAHLGETLKGRRPNWSAAGYQNMLLRHRQPANLVRVDTYGQRRKCGDARLHQIILTALRLGKDSPYLLGTSHHTKKAQIDMSSYSTIERAWLDLCAKWGVDPAL